MPESGDVVMCLACNGRGKGGKDHVYLGKSSYYRKESSVKKTENQLSRS